MSKERSRRQTVMRHIFTFFTFVAATAVITSCSDELFLDEPTPFTVVGETVDVDLALSVSDLSIEMTTRTAFPKATDGEKKINDVWVFQYDYDSKYLIQARYYEVSEDDKIDENSGTVTLHIKLNDNNGSPCIVYVVANTGNENWAASATSENTSSDFYTLDELKKHTIPNAAPIRIGDSTEEGSTTDADLSIPMGGSLGEDGSLTINGGPDETIEIPVTRMFAKLYVTVKLNPSSYDASMTSMTIDNIPDFCTVGTVYENDTWYNPTDVSGNLFDVSRTFTPDESTKKEDGDKTTYGEFVIYVPENLQGTSTTDAIKITPSLAVQVSLEDGNNSKATINTSSSYVAYPGSWDYTTDPIEPNAEYGKSLDIRRNNIYDITLTINIDEYDLAQPSANCLIAKPGETIAFYPYDRDEKPSEELQAESNYASTLKARYDFTTYLNSSYEGEAANDGKKIKSVKIIWQYPQGFIGDNKDGDLVWIDPEPGEHLDLDDEERAVAKSYDEFHRKIYVKTASAGNALIAAYDDYEGNGNILWSWHIWAPNEGVDPETGAIEYYHLKWNSTDGILWGSEDSYEPGPSVMNLNLGALAEKPTAKGVFTHDTYGTIYQWGRKDPFLPVSEEYHTIGGFQNTIPCYDNSNKLIDISGNNGALAATSNTSVFWTDAPNNVPGGTLSLDDDAIIKQTILHPTMFVASMIGDAGRIWNDASGYYNEGDWLPTGDDFLWGGGHTNASSEYQVYSQDSESDVYDPNYPIDAYLEDDFGPEKTIFDPCPYGWRVTNGDLWLGFTDNGLNWCNTKTPKVVNDGNIVEKFENTADYQTITYDQNGYTIYMQGWHGSLGNATSFFPFQCTRNASGTLPEDYVCGNYANATVDKPMTYINGTGTIRRIEILHVHNNYSLSENLIYTYGRETYYCNKTTACPVRCVRDTK